MDIDVLNIDGVMVPHVIVRMLGDGACLFRALSYIMYNTQSMACKLREEIVVYVSQHWDHFSILSHDTCGNNFNCPADYLAEMKRPYTYAGVCELEAAGQLYPYIFEVYLHANLVYKCGSEGNPVHRLRFSSTQDNSNGHFDIYVPYDNGLPLSASELPIVTDVASTQTNSTANCMKAVTKRRRRAKSTTLTYRKRQKKARATQGTNTKTEYSSHGNNNTDTPTEKQPFSK